MRAKELREESMGELRDTLLSLLRRQVTYRIQKAQGQLAKTHHLRQLRRDIARCQTVLHEKPPTDEKEG